MAATTTTLSTAITASDTELYVASLSGFPARGSSDSRFCQIDDEQLVVTGVTSAGIVRVRLRGANGTTATAHSVGAPVSVSTLASDFPVAPYSSTAGNLATSGGIVTLSGSSDPSTTTGIGVAGPGSTYIQTTSKTIFENIGTSASPTWRNIAGAQGPVQQSGVMSSADLTGTSAGQFGHASGYPLIAAPGTGVTLFPLLVILGYTRLTATYGDGGDTTLNYGGGGAALTGAVTAANFAGAAADKSVVLVPVAPTANALSANTGLNLVTAAAFTNPGTAAGTINWRVIYVTHS